MTKAIDTSFVEVEATKSVLPPPPQQPGQLMGWSLERYHLAIEKGILTELDPVELVFGQLIEKMPVGEDHADILGDIAAYVEQKLDFKEYKFRQQNPVTLPSHSEPEPDYAVVRRQPYNKSTGHPKPGDIFLLVEISDSTLNYDRTTKQKMYAGAGVEEYWIVNLVHRRVEVYLNPDTEQQEYLRIGRYSEAEEFDSPFCGLMQVANLLPVLEEE